MIGEKNEKINLVIGELGVCTLFFLSILAFGSHLLGADLIPFLKWWGALLCLGLAFIPLTTVIFKKFHNRGYLFSKTIGLVVTGWLMWLCSSLHILKFNTPNSIICLVICALLNYGIYFFYRKRKGETKSLSVFKNLCQECGWKKIVTLELVFMLVLMVFTYMRANVVEACTAEKFMNYAFLTNMLRTDYMPPIDSWVSGMYLNYYYFGQYLITFLTRISFNTANYGYILGIMTVASFCLMLVYSLVNQLMITFLSDLKKMTGKLEGKLRRIAAITGIVAALAVTIAGNFHYIIFYKIVPVIWEFLQIPGELESYIFTSSTRYIGYIPEVTDDMTITEFPAYSFIAGDLHAHIVNVLLVTTLLGVLFAWLLSHREKINMVRKGEAVAFILKEEITNVNIIFLGFLIGIFHMSNYWDFPIYYVVCGAVILAVNGIISGFKGKTILFTAVEGFLILIISELVSLPFNLKFHKMVGGIAFSEKHSLLRQLIVLWGLPTFILIGFLVALIYKEYSRRKVEKVAKNGVFFQFLQNLWISDLFVIILGLCAVGLVMIPEIIYVKDIFYAGFPRCNTMYKLTYQAFIMFGICMGYIICRFIFTHETKRQLRGGIIAGVILLMTMGYWVTATNQRFGNYWDVNNYKGLDATNFVSMFLPDDEAAIDWLNDNIKERTVVLEANGDSYTLHNRVSVLTGLPTVMGWHTHEWLWMDDLEMVDARGADVTTIYTSTDIEQVKTLIETYDISYIFIGTMEYEKYETINTEQLISLGEIVFEKTDTATGNPTYIIKLEK